MNSVVTVKTMYFYTTLHDLIWLNFGLSWPKCDTFSIIQALMRVLLRPQLHKLKFDYAKHIFCHGEISLCVIDGLLHKTLGVQKMFTPSSHIIYHIIKIGLRSHDCAKWLLPLISKLIVYYC